MNDNMTKEGFLYKIRRNLYEIKRNPLKLCPFYYKPSCEFPCRICKICRISSGCMGCIHPERKLKHPCTDYNTP